MRLAPALGKKMTYLFLNFVHEITKLKHMFIYIYIYIYIDIYYKNK